MCVFFDDLETTRNVKGSRCMERLSLAVTSKIKQTAGQVTLMFESHRGTS